MLFRTDGLGTRIFTVWCFFLFTACVISRVNDANSEATSGSGVKPSGNAKVETSTGPAKTDTQVAKAADQAPVAAAASTAAAASKPAESPVAKVVPAKSTAVRVAKVAKVAATPASSVAPANGASASTFGKRQSVRYVLADVVNVHAAPRLDAPIVAKVARGSCYPAAVGGSGTVGWAKLGEGQYILLKYLSRSEGHDWAPATRAIAQGK